MAAGWRLRARLDFVPGNGMGAWALAQNENRLAQAYHLNPGTLNEERSRHAVTGNIYTCDLAFTSEALALDTWNTLLAVAVPGYLVAPTVKQFSWMDLHLCRHDDKAPCEPPARRWENRA